MIRIILIGCNGRMGQAMTARIKEEDNMDIVAGMDMDQDAVNGYPVHGNFYAITETADVVVDFSHMSLTPALLEFCLEKKLPLVLCTTGIAGELEDKVIEAAKEIPLFRSFNMSLGVSLLQALVRQAARVLGNTYDIEIIEKHHNKKVDAPSGTAIMIAQAAASALTFEPQHTYDRTKEHKQRERHEIGVHSIRGGTIVGEHEAMFIGPYEVLTISHSAESRDLFANGAIKAIEFLLDDPQPGLYNMDDLVQSLS